MKINIIILIIVLVSISCKHTIFLEDTFEHVQDVDLIELADFHTDSIGAPIFIYTSKNNVILIEPQMAHLISAYNISNKKYEKFLLKGKGPNESLDIQQIGQAENDSLFFVMDTYTKKVFVYSLQDTSHSIHHQIDIPDLTTSFCCDSNLIIGALSGDDKRFYIKSSEIIRYFGSAIPVLDYPTSITSQVLGGFCCNSSKRKKIAWFSLYGDCFEIYDYQNLDSVYLIHQTIGIMPIFTTESIRNNILPVFSGKTKLGVTSLSVNNNYIFALYNNHLLRDATKLKDNIFYGDKILVYDWDGNPYKILRLHERVKAIHYDQEKDVIYAIGCDSKGPKILFIDCKSIL